MTRPKIQKVVLKHHIKFQQHTLPESNTEQKKWYDFSWFRPLNFSAVRINILTMAYLQFIGISDVLRVVKEARGFRQV